MAGCGCDCEIVANYRGQRVPANESFVSWINRRHDFYENEECGDVRGMDTYGPDTLETDGGWTQLVSYEDYATGGELTIGPFCASSHWVDLFSPGYSDTTNKVPVALNSTVTYVAFGKTAGLEVREIYPTVGEIGPSMGGVPGLAWATPAQYGAAFGVPEKFAFITYEGESLRWRTQQIRVDAWHELDDGESPWVITVSGSPRHISIFGNNAFPELTMAEWNVSSGLINKAPFFFPGAETVDGEWRSYFNTPAVVLGEKVTLYRDGEVVLEGIRPSAAQTLAATEVDGSYLIVSEVDESTTPPWGGPGTDYRKRYPRPTKLLGSFVVDREGPVIGATAPQDFYVDNPYQAFGGSSYADQGDPQAIMSTKPIGIDTGGITIYMPSDGGAVPRPYVAPLGVSIWRTAGDQNLLNMSAGVYAVVPMDLVGLKDHAGNPPAYTPTFTVQVHAVPQNNRRGARPKLENVGLQTREQFRARYEHEQVRQVVLTWDRKVKANTVSVSQVSLTQNGQSVPGCTIEQRTPTSWVITLPGGNQDGQEPQEPVALQGSKSFWVLTYDPGGEVLTDDDPDNPEPCVLAARTSWLMSCFEGFLEPEDCSSEFHFLGTVPSITKESSAPPLEQEHVVTISTKGGFGIGEYGAGTLGSHARSVAPDSFTPAVPAAFVRPPGIDTDDDGVEDEPPAGWDDNCSYWGLGMSIWPCKPRTISKCACPKKAQTGASVIVGAGERESIRLRVESERPATIRQNSFPFPPAMSGDIVCTRSFNGCRLPQNTWAGALPALSPMSYDSSWFDEQQKKWFGGVTTVTPLGGTVNISAFRGALAYPARKTAYLCELEFFVSMRYWSLWQYDPADPQEDAPEDKYLVHSNDDRFCLSRDQEMILSQGGEVRTLWGTPYWEAGWLFASSEICWWHISLQ